jgi:hypothetical protein
METIQRVIFITPNFQQFLLSTIWSSGSQFIGWGSQGSKQISQQDKKIDLNVLSISG